MKTIKIKQLNRVLSFKGEPRGHLEFNLNTDNHDNVEFYIEAILDNKYRFELTKDEVRELKVFLDLICLKQLESV